MEIKYDSAQKRLQLTENKTTDQWGTVGLTCLHYLFTSHSFQIWRDLFGRNGRATNWAKWQEN